MRSPTTIRAPTSASSWGWGWVAWSMRCCPGEGCGMNPTRRTGCCGRRGFSPPEPSGLIPVLDQATVAVGVEQRHGAQRPHERRVLAEGALPTAALGHESADDYGLGIYTPDEPQGRRQGRTGGDDIVNDGDAAPPDGVDPGRIHAQPLGLVGGDGVNGLGPTVTKVDLGRLVQDHIVVDPQRTAGFDGDGDAHRRN